jgi:hypothetical protein
VNGNLYPVNAHTAGFAATATNIGQQGVAIPESCANVELSVYLDNPPGLGSLYAFDFSRGDAGTGSSNSTVNDVVLISSSQLTSSGTATGINLDPGDVLLIRVRAQSAPAAAAAVWHVRCSN